MRISIIFALLSFFSACANGQHPLQYETTEIYIDEVARITRFDLPVYISVNVINQRGHTNKALLLNKHLYFCRYNDLDFFAQYVDTLKSIMTENRHVISDSSCSLEQFHVVSEMYDSISGMTVDNILDKYFDENGLSRNNRFYIKEIEAAVAVLVDRRLIVYEKHGFFIVPLGG